MTELVKAPFVRKLLHKAFHQASHSLDEQSCLRRNTGGDRGSNSLMQIMLHRLRRVPPATLTKIIMPLVKSDRAPKPQGCWGESLVLEQEASLQMPEALPEPGRATST